MRIFTSCWDENSVAVLSESVEQDDGRRWRLRTIQRHTALRQNDCHSAVRTLHLHSDQTAGHESLFESEIRRSVEPVRPGRCNEQVEEE
jgi:hypothetical protein